MKNKNIYNKMEKAVIPSFGPVSFTDRTAFFSKSLPLINSSFHTTEEL